MGYILSQKEQIQLFNMDYLEKSYESGLRAIGPAHYGPEFMHMELTRWRN